MFADQLFTSFFITSVAVWVLIVVGFGLVLNQRVHQGPR